MQAPLLEVVKIRGSILFKLESLENGDWFEVLEFFEFRVNLPLNREHIFWFKLQAFQHTFLVRGYLDVQSIPAQSLKFLKVSLLLDKRRSNEPLV